MNLLDKWQKYGTIFLIIFLLGGCATTQEYYAFTPTVLRFQIKAPTERVYSQLLKSIKDYPFKVLKESEDGFTILTTSRLSSFQKVGLFAGKLLMGASYKDKISFVIIPKDRESELQIAIVAFQRLPGFVEQIPIDSENQLYKQANYLAEEVKKQVEAY